MKKVFVWIYKGVASKLISKFEEDVGQVIYDEKSHEMIANLIPHETDLYSSTSSPASFCH